MKLIESTQAIIENDEYDYDEIWCVFDMDFKEGEREFADFDNAIEKGESLGYNIAYSNDCFEVWFYLHFDYLEQKNHRTFYYKTLGEKWSLNYEKSGKSYKFSESIYERLENDENASQEKAIERAEKLFKKQSDLVYHKQNPITLVYQLVKFLNNNKRR